jgi:hypothetical protein
MAHAKSVTLHLSTQNQKMDNLQSILKRVGGMIGCEACGRMALLRIDLLGDPAADLAKQGVTSMQVHE